MKLQAENCLSLDKIAREPDTLFPLHSRRASLTTTFTRGAPDHSSTSLGGFDNGTAAGLHGAPPRGVGRWRCAIRHGVILHPAFGRSSDPERCQPILEPSRPCKDVSAETRGWSKQRVRSHALKWPAPLPAGVGVTSSEAAGPVPAGAYSTPSRSRRPATASPERPD